MSALNKAQATLIACFLFVFPALADGISNPGSGATASGITTACGGVASAVLFNNSTSCGGDSKLTYAGAGSQVHLQPAANTNQPFLISGGSTTGSSTATLGYAITGTLNTSGVVDGAALFANITNTASGAGTTLVDLQVGGVSTFSVDTNGIINVTDLSAAGGGFNLGHGSTRTLSIGWPAGGEASILLDSAGIIKFTSSASLSTSTDLAISRSAAGVIAFGSGGAGDGSATILAKTKAGAPTTSDVTAGTWVLIRDTTNATTKLYYNNAGALQSVALN